VKHIAEKAGRKPGTPSNQSEELLSLSALSPEEALLRLGTRLEGLTAAEVQERCGRYGPNQLAAEKRISPLHRLLENVKNPLVILLTGLAIVSYLTGDLRAAIVILAMVLLGIVLRFFQEARADDAAAHLKAMVGTHATAVRDGVEAEIPLAQIVPGDIVRLSAGDMAPADIRVLRCKDLFLNQSALTGESVPVEKTPDAVRPEKDAGVLDMQNLCFQGSNVESGTGLAVVVHTGENTYFGSLAAGISAERQPTGFDRGVNKFTWLMIRFMAVMVPAVFLLNGASKHNWMEAFLFSVAVAVGLTPEMLPMIVTVNLSNGALTMSRQKVIVKRLNAIQNFGAMDVLCTDKTGTLTEGRIVLERYLDPRGNPSEKALHFAYLNSFHHTGLKNMLDQAVLDHGEVGETLKAGQRYKKIDEIPFDFIRRRMSVIVEDDSGLNILLCKGAVDEILSVCTRVDHAEGLADKQEQHDVGRREMADKLSAEGFRVIAIAYKEMPNAPDVPVYTVEDESDLILVGFLAFLDPPKETAREALERLKALNVDVKILTGDSGIITAYVCGKVGIPVDTMLLGADIERLSDTELTEAAAKTRVFARLAPAHKERIIRALQAGGHVTGFMGDGINDAPALKAADVGISVNTAVDIAKESSDIILLENSLLVLEQGVLAGRRVFGNIIKYIKMAASSNFGNMFSVVGASAFLPFLPMLPIQVLTNNLLYDFSQTAIPTDNVDEEWLTKPRQWTINELQRFIVVLGPISSIFDYLTFYMMMHLFHCAHNPVLFHTGWFMESLFTQTLIIHVIRTNKVPFIGSRASWQLCVTSLIILLVGAWLPVSPLAGTLGFAPLPSLFWGMLALMMLGYMALTQAVKIWFVRTDPSGA
jgi:P-type Mg2+ transporter